MSLLVVIGSNGATVSILNHFALSGGPCVAVQSVHHDAGHHGVFSTAGGAHLPQTGWPNPRYKKVSHMYFQAQALTM